MTCSPGCIADRRRSASGWAAAALAAAAGPYSWEAAARATLALYERIRAMTGRLAPGDLFAHDRRDLGPEQLDRAHHVRVSDGADAHLADVALLPNSSCSNRIFSATCSGEPAATAPRGERSASYSSRPDGGQPRSRPIRFIIAR